MILLMGDMAGAIPSCPDISAMFWPVLSLGALVGLMGGLVLSFILISIFRESQ